LTHFLIETIDADELLPLLQMMSQTMKLSLGAAKKLFELVFFTAHGIASLLANNGMTYDEKHVQDLLTDTFSHLRS